MTRDEQKSVDRQQENNMGYLVGGCTGKGWLPGQSGNPAGRPPNKRYISDILRGILNRVPVKELAKLLGLPEGTVEGENTDVLVALALLKKALSGDTKAIDMIFDRTEGKVSDKIEGTENPVTIILRPARDRGVDPELYIDPPM